MTQELKNVLKSRFYSFLWRIGAYVAIAVLNFAMEQVGLFDLPPAAVVVIAYVVGEITKFINVNLPELREKK
jgi:hypothetical protein